MRSFINAGVLQMMGIKRVLKRCIHIGLLLEILLLLPSGARGEDVLQSVVKSFDVADANVPDALIELGRTSGVPFGIVATNPDLWNKKVSLSLSNTTLEALLKKVLSGFGNYTWSIQNGVVVVYNPELRTADDFLHVKINDFQSTQPETVENLSVQLWMNLLVTLNPNREEGFAGVLHPSSLDNKLPAVDLSGESVQVILDWLVSHHGKAAWITLPYKGDIQQASGDDLWKIIFYDEQPSR